LARRGFTTSRRLTSYRRLNNVFAQVWKDVFFLNCSLFVDGRYWGSGSGSGEADGRLFECYGDGKVLRLGEDGYVSYENDVIEVGLLRDCGGGAEVRLFEDGELYIYRSNVCGSGVYEGRMATAFMDVNYLMATATFASIFLTAAVSLHET
jgi:hypothetical protein